MIPRGRATVPVRSFRGRWRYRRVMGNKSRGKKDERNSSDASSMHKQEGERKGGGRDAN